MIGLPDYQKIELRKLVHANFSFIFTCLENELSTSKSLAWKHHIKILHHDHREIYLQSKIHRWASFL